MPVGLPATERRIGITRIRPCGGLDDDGVTEAINRVIAGPLDDHQSTDAPAAALAASDWI